MANVCRVALTISFVVGLPADQAPPADEAAATEADVEALKALEEK